MFSLTIFNLTMSGILKGYTMSSRGLILSLLLFFSFFTSFPSLAKPKECNLPGQNNYLKINQNLGVGIRGNGEFIFVHWGVLA